MAWAHDTRLNRTVAIKVPLAARLAHGRLPVDRAIRYAREIGAALSAAHAAGIVHRDLRPASVMLTRSGATLLDFGLAKPGPAPAATALTDADTRQPITDVGATPGTP